MRTLKVSGDFKETSNSCNEFIEQLISYLKEDNNDYFKIKQKMKFYLILNILPIMKLNSTETLFLIFWKIQMIILLSLEE